MAADSLRVTRRITAQPALAKYRPDEFKPGVSFRSDEELARLAGDIATTIFHPVGTARMGRDPRTSVLNGFCQAHDVPNLFVTDGACMTSSANQNPSITYMALTARAVDYAVERMKRNEL